MNMHEALEARKAEMEARVAAAAEAQAALAAAEAALAAEEDWEKRITLRHTAEKLRERATWLAKPFAVLPLQPEEIAAVAAVAAAFLPVSVRVNLSSTGGFLVEAVQTDFAAVVKNAADLAAARTEMLAKMDADAAEERERMVREINHQRDWYWRESGKRITRPEQPVTDEDVARWKATGQC